MIAPPVECPMQKQGSPGFSVKTFSRNDFCKDDDDSESLCQQQDVLETIENERERERERYQIFDSVVKGRDISMKSIASTMTCKTRPQKLYPESNK